MTNVLFTGLTGFLGKNFSKLVHDKQLNIMPLPCDALFGKTEKIDFNYHFSVDELKSSGVDNIDVLVHAGAFSPKTRAQMNDIPNNLLNITNTAYLLAHLPNKPKRVIYISSISVYDLSQGGIVNEKTIAPADSLYGLSKLMSEKVVQTYCAQNEIECQILRLGVMYGDNLSYQGLIPTFIDNILNGRKSVVYNAGKTQRNFIHVEDVCRVIHQSIIQKKVQFPIVNVVAYESISIMDVLKMLEKIHGQKIEIENVAQAISAADVIFDTTVLKEAFDMPQLSYEDGLKRAYHFFLGEAK